MYEKNLKKLVCNIITFYYSQDYGSEVLIIAKLKSLELKSSFCEFKMTVRSYCIEISWYNWLIYSYKIPVGNFTSSSLNRDQ